jgi:hypothetical protein
MSPFGPERGFDDCFSRKSMNLVILDAEDVALQMEGSDLPPTIGQECGVLAATVEGHWAFED